MSRWKAAALQLPVSAAVALVAYLLLAVVWYPGELLDAAGGRRLLYLIVGLELAAGPLLWLVVHDTRKKELKLDLAIVTLARVAVVGFAFFIAANARPIAIAFVVDRFAVVPSNAVAAADLAQAPSAELRERSWTGPRLVAAVPPSDPQERSEVLESAIAGLDVDRLPKYWRPYAERQAEAAGRALPLERLAARDARSRSIVDAFLASRDDDADLAYLPITARAGTWTAIVGKSTGTYVALLPIDPFEAP
jgi:hypothetical protein